MMSEKELYNIALEDKKHYETVRDQVSNNYITLFSIIIAVIPFIGNIVESAPGRYGNLIVGLSLTVLSIIGLSLAIIWQLSLKKIIFIIRALDDKILDTETKYNIEFKLKLAKQLEETKGLSKVTKYQILIPKLFTCIFVIVLIYSILHLLVA